MIRASTVQILRIPAVTFEKWNRLEPVGALVADVEAGFIKRSCIRQHPPHDLPSRDAVALAGRMEVDTMFREFVRHADRNPAAGSCNGCSPLMF